MRPEIIGTERLLLRPHRPSDIDACHRLWTQPDVVEQAGEHPTREQTWNRMLGYAGLRPLLGLGYWVIEDRVEGEVIGEIGVADFRPETDPPLEGDAQLGGVISADCRGQGVATEAGRAVLRLADSRPNLRRLQGLVSPGNVPTLIISAKFGFRQTGVANWRGRPYQVWTRERPAE